MITSRESRKQDDLGSFFIRHQQKVEAEVDRGGYGKYLKMRLGLPVILVQDLPLLFFLSFLTLFQLLHVSIQYCQTVKST